MTIVDPSMARFVDAIDPDPARVMARAQRLERQQVRRDLTTLALVCAVVLALAVLAACGPVSDAGIAGAVQ